MRNIMEIHSAEGSYFVIGKNEDGYYLRNEYTVIPNELGRYSIDKVKELFDGLCERVPECVEIEDVSYYDQHPNGFIYVVYDDMSEHLYREQVGVGKNLCAFTYKASQYSEFWDKYWCSTPSTIGIDRLRLVLKNKIEDYDVFYKLVTHTDLDDYTFWKDTYSKDGSIYIEKTVYINEYKDYVTIDSDGHIGNTGGLGFVEMMKEAGVIVKKNKN